MPSRLANTGRLAIPTAEHNRTSGAFDRSIALRAPLYRSRTAPAVAQLEIEIPPIDEHPECLAEDEDRVADVERIGQKQEAPADREEPEGDRHHHFSGSLGGDPLHQETHGEHDLCDIAEQHPP